MMNMIIAFSQVFHLNMTCATNKAEGKKLTPPPHPTRGEPRQSCHTDTEDRPQKTKYLLPSLNTLAPLQASIRSAIYKLRTSRTHDTYASQRSSTRASRVKFKPPIPPHPISLITMESPSIHRPLSLLLPPSPLSFPYIPKFQIRQDLA